MPYAIKSHIDKNHYYTTEGGSYNGSSPYDSQTKCGVALMSVTELSKYKDRLGMADGNFASVSQWWNVLRTPGKRIDFYWESRFIGVQNNNGSYSIGTTAMESNRVRAIRPIFWLDESFFDDVSVTDMGEEVIAALR